MDRYCEVTPRPDGSVTVHFDPDAPGSHQEARRRIAAAHEAAREEVG